MRVRAAVGLVLASVLVAGCGGAAKVSPGDAKPKGEAKAKVTKTPEAVPDTGPLKMGETYRAQRATMQVLKYQATGIEPKSEAGKGRHWAGALVRGCNTGLKKRDDQIQVFAWEPWALTDADGGQYPAANSTYNDFPLPQYPFSGQAVGVGKCVKGWVVFAVPDDVKPTMVSLIEVKDWAVG